MQESWTHFGKASFAMRPDECDTERILFRRRQRIEESKAVSASRATVNTVSDPGPHYIRESAQGVGPKAVIHVTKIRSILLIADSGVLKASEGGQGKGTAHNAAQSANLREGSIKGTQNVITIGVGPACIDTYADKCLGESERMRLALEKGLDVIDGLVDGAPTSGQLLHWEMLLDLLGFLVECQFVGGSLRRYIEVLRLLFQHNQSLLYEQFAHAWSLDCCRAIVRVLRTFLTEELFLLNMPVVIRVDGVDVEGHTFPTIEACQATEKKHGCLQLNLPPKDRWNRFPPRRLLGRDTGEPQAPFPGFFKDPVDDKGYLSVCDLQLKGAWFFCPFSKRWQSLASLCGSSSEPLWFVVTELRAAEGAFKDALLVELDSLLGVWVGALDLAQSTSFDLHFDTQPGASAATAPVPTSHPGPSSSSPRPSGSASTKGKSSAGPPGRTPPSSSQPSSKPQGKSSGRQPRPNDKKPPEKKPPDDKKGKRK